MASRVRHNGYTRGDGVQGAGSSNPLPFAPMPLATNSCRLEPRWRHLSDGCVRDGQASESRYGILAASFVAISLGWREMRKNCAELVCCPAISFNKSRRTRGGIQGTRRRRIGNTATTSNAVARHEDQRIMKFIAGQHTK